MRRLRESIGLTRGERFALAVTGVLLIGLGALLAWFGGFVLVPFGVVALTLAVVPARWSLRRGLVLAALAMPALFGAGGTAYIGYSCVRPEPWLDVRFADEDRATALLTDVANGEEAFTSSSDGDGRDEHRVFFSRDASSTRDRVAGELREHPSVAEVTTGEEHCD